MIYNNVCVIRKSYSDYIVFDNIRKHSKMKTIFKVETMQKKPCLYKKITSREAFSHKVKYDSQSIL